MKKIIVYTMHYCPYCESAKKLLKQKAFTFEEKIVSLDDEETWKQLEKQTGYKTMPQIFIGDQFIGGYTELLKLSDSGKLDTLVNS